ncbi:TetR/AcrR family transcriptional regulator [Agromyces binzhouensis]|uniref:TetR family transcriptional regulator n=1 Tax=Agromyces binzhouensis TaxID=1817495 RepID=A0A4Q2JGT4_9MICO|nr:TetR family transcriptional regulator C-terminal domain-containing protein [Agromyces binzhouensis]RXZ47115.1 TetR family transcriptional regulator [Agromyces binzhouensis]
MARPKRQEERRSQLVAAAQRAIALHGPDGARLNRVAEEAGLTSGAVLYYYPDIDELMFEANRAGMERFYEGRVRMLEGLPDDPVARLVALIDSGLPSGSDDTEVRLLCELGGSAGRNPLMASLLTTLYDRQVGMYQVVLEQGAARGLFALAQPTLVIARNLVALEDAYGYRIVAKHPTLDRAAAAELLREYARLATGHALTS